MPPLISVFYAKEGKSLLSFNFSVSQYQKIMLKQLGVRKNFGYRKKFCIGGYHDFLSKKFRLTVPKNFVGEPFCVSKKICYRKIICMGGGGIKVLSKIFCFSGPKNFVRDPLCGSEIFLCGKKLWIRDGEGDITFSVENFLSNSAPKLRADHQCFKKNWVSKNFTHKKGMSLFYV